MLALGWGSEVVSRPHAAPVLCPHLIEKGRGIACLLAQQPTELAAAQGYRLLTLVEPARSLVVLLGAPVRTGIWHVLECPA
jgi:hypothetical protein